MPTPGYLVLKHHHFHKQGLATAVLNTTIIDLLESAIILSLSGNHSLEELTLKDVFKGTGQETK